MCAYRYYRSFYWCMSDYWLHIQPNCTSEVVSAIKGAADWSIVAFTSRYDCPIVSNASTPGSVFIRY